ncbi:MAG TPA: pyridoxal phosphate-dependent aminotransferase [Candidatus Phocaeicola gallinarum]|nr:pyridoxal phosphate-dependent aminotransferase [Candidatus Phocaeicola gallinarum]
MKYDFDEVISRRGTLSYKWDSATDAEVLPLWVADMDFRTSPAIIEALQRRVAHGIFGYTRVPDAYYQAVTNWFARRHGWNIQREWMIYTSGVVPAVSAVIKALTVPGDKVLVQTPVYNCFFSSIRNNGCTLAASPLLRVGNTWQMDFEDLERKASDPDVKVFLLCNPHNPVGRVWTREELLKAGEICSRHGVTVVSDEIHCELVYPGHAYTPFASISGDFSAHAIVCISPSKAFNIAGLQIANIVVPDEEVRRKIDKAININEVCDVNPFGVTATIAAYTEGEEWLNQLLVYLQANYKWMQDYCRTHLPDFPISDLEGTYLVWMDCSILHKTSDVLEQELLDESKLWLNAGTMYGAEGEGFMRWNIACPRSVLAEGLERFRSYVYGK